jgi:hypothetical protein
MEEKGKFISGFNDIFVANKNGLETREKTES